MSRVDSGCSCSEGDAVKLPTIYKHELYEFLAATKAELAKHPRSKDGRGAATLADAIIAHFGLKAGAQVTIVRDE